MIEILLPVFAGAVGAVTWELLNHFVYDVRFWGVTNEVERLRRELEYDDTEIQMPEPNTTRIVKAKVGKEVVATFPGFDTDDFPPCDDCLTKQAEIERLQKMLSYGYKAGAIGVEAATATASADGRGTPVSEMDIVEIGEGANE